VLPVVDLSRRGARFADRFAADAQRIARSGQYLLGPELEAFEREFANAVHATHVVGVSSGAAALQLALVAAGVAPGDDVLVPAFTAVPTASAVMAMGARPVAVDVDRRTACLTADRIEAARTERTTAVIVVHLYGYPVDVTGIADSGLIVIEDAAQAGGALSSPARSAATAYSFYPTKNLGGIGDGGAVVTDDASIAERVRMLRTHGMTTQYVHEAVSQNFRMSELEAAWLRLTLSALHDDNDARRRIAERCRSAAPGLTWSAPHPDHVYHLSVMRSHERDAVRERLADSGIATAIHYPVAITSQPAFADLRREVGQAPCPEAEAWAQECVSIPCFPEMTDAELDALCAILSALDT
jgi:dTDP-3-amino-3,4,6-trideoxy-alpha-D-glucose transaminase